MDTAKLIEEAERWARNVSESPGNGTAGEDLYGAKLLCDLAAALKASEERAEKAEERARQQDGWAENIAAVAEQTNVVARECIRERDALAAANLAANKRIEALEHERDAALLATKEAHRLAFNAEQKAKALDAVQRDTIARLEAQTKELSAELTRLTTPRPIAEAPRDGTWVLLPFSTSKWDACRGPSPQYVTARWFAAAWADPNGALLTEPSHYLPLPDVKP